MNNFDYKNMTPFKWFVLENFPFIENDFDAINNYHLFSKVVEYLNKVIDDMNQVGQQTENITNAMTELQNYVNNYFDNLDVQDEINNKLDEMATDGTLENIINQEIFSDMNNRITANTNNILSNNVRYKIIGVGDSYGIQQFEDKPITKYYWEYLTDALGLTVNETFFKAYASGASFKNGNFLQSLRNLENTITNKNEITDILITGGWNDIYADITEQMIINAMTTFNTYAKSNYPNARIKLGFIGYSNPYITGNSSNVSLLLKALQAYKKGADLLGWQFLNGCENIMHFFDTTYWQADGVHPSQKGQDEIGHYIIQAFLNGNVEIFRKSEDTGIEIVASGICSQVPTNRNKFLYSQNNHITKIETQQLSGQYFVLDNTTELNMNGANSYEIANMTNDVWYGWNNRNSNTQPFQIQVMKNGALKTYHGLANFFLRQGKLNFNPLCFDLETNQAVSGVTGRYLYISSLCLISDTKLC